jgi:hypothetical protein
MLKKLLIPCALLLCAQATAPNDPAAEVARLRAENAQLRAELAAIKARQITTTQPAASPATRPVVRRFTSMPDLLSNTPLELRPKANAEWHKYMKAKFEQWWHDQLIGMQFEQTMACTCSVDRAWNPQPGAEFTLRGNFESKDFVAFTADHSWGIVGFEQRVDETTAKKWERVKPGTLFKVTGTIKASTVRSSSYSGWPRYQVTLTLADFDMAPAN